MLFLQGLLINFVASFVCCSTFAVLMHVPKNCIFPGGIVGALGWSGYWMVNRKTHGVFLASMLCALILAEASRLLSQKMKKPAILFFIPGLVPVVPGVTFFHGFQALIMKEYVRAGHVFLDVLYNAVGIAIGFTISSILQEIYAGVRNYRKKIN